MNLIIDIGNCLTKVAIFEKKEVCDIFTTEALHINLLHKIHGQYPNINHSIISSVKNINSEIVQFVRDKFLLMTFNFSTPIPISIKYKTPDTLGLDRLASAVGAYCLYPQNNILVIDAGTCIKYDFITAHKEYLGGAISPGIVMRLKALNSYTDKLPLIDLEFPENIIGNSTKQSILSGVMNGAIKEVDGFINDYKSQYPNLRVILSGGDINCFEDKLKNSIFAVPYIVLKGLNEILLYNVENDK